MADADSPLPALELLSAGLCGLLMGSFLNACIYRLPRDFSVVRPRSFCPECGKQVRWYDNIPLLSYCLLRGRCRNCGKPISRRYPIVEITTAGLYAATIAQHGWTMPALKLLILLSLLIVLFWTDWEERLLPDALTLSGVVIGLLFSFFVFLPAELSTLLLPEYGHAVQSFFDSVLGASMVSAPFWLLGRLYALLRKREGLGLGDVKLLALIGSFFGATLGLAVVLIASLAGSMIGLLYVAVTHRSVSEYSLPFGSFLAVSAIAVALSEAPLRAMLHMLGY